MMTYKILFWCLSFDKDIYLSTSIKYFNSFYLWVVRNNLLFLFFPICGFSYFPCFLYALQKLSKIVLVNGKFG